MAARKAWFTEDVKREKFLTAIRNGASNLQACEAAGWKWATVEGWIDTDDAIRAEVELARGFAPVVTASKSQDKHVARGPKTGADKWQRLKNESAKIAPGLAGILLYVDGLLATKGHPPMSDWWRQTLCNFYVSGKRWCLLLVGRGGGKSTTLERAALVESIFEQRKSPPGQTWSWLFLSVLKSDARKRLDEIGALLDAIGVSHERTAPDGVPTLTFEDANGNQVSLISIAATIAATSGPTSIGCTCDEEEKWADEKTGANPASEVLRSLRQTFRTRPNVRAYRCSSKFDDANIHFKDIKSGDTAAHFVARLGPVGLPLALQGFERAAQFEALHERHDNARKLREYAATLTEQSTAIPAWVANPTHDIEQGRVDEEDFDSWMREVASHGDGAPIVGNMFQDGLLERALATHPIEQHSMGERFAAIDTGSSENPSALCIVERVASNGRYHFRPLVLKQWERQRNGLPMDLQNEVLPEMARLMKQNKCFPRWWADGYAGFAIEHVGANEGIETQYVSTSTAYRDTYAPLLVALRQTPCPLALGGRLDGLDKAVQQLRQTKRETSKDGHRAVLPKVGTEHGELGQVLVRALAHAGVGTMPPNESASKFVGIPDRYSAFRGSGSRSYR